MRRDARARRYNEPVDADTPAARTQALRRAERIRAFESELEALRREIGFTLTAAQRAAVAAHHAALLARDAARFDISSSPRHQRLTRGMVFVAGVAVAALGASVALFFFRIWGGLSTASQVATVVALPFLSMLATEIAARARPLRFLVAMLALLAFAAFVLDVEVIARIFALPPTSEALLAYGVFATGLAYGYGPRLLVAIGAGCLLMWVAATFVRLTGAWWPAFPERPESFIIAGWLVGAWSLLPHPRHDGHPPVLRTVAVVAVGLAVLVMGHAGQQSWLPGDPDAIEATYQIASFVLSSAAVWVGLKRDWPELFAGGGIWFGASLLLKYVDWWWSWLPGYVFFLIVAATAVAILWILRRLRASAAGGQR